MASVGSAVSHRGTKEGMASGVGVGVGAIGADSQFDVSRNLAQDLTEHTRIASDVHLSKQPINQSAGSDQPIQQSAETAANTAAAECPDLTGQPIEFPLTPSDSASPGRQQRMSSGWDLPAAEAYKP